MYFTKKKLRV